MRRRAPTVTAQHHLYRLPGFKWILKSFEMNWGYACQDFSPCHGLLLCDLGATIASTFPETIGRNIDVFLKWSLFSHVSVISEHSEVNQQTEDITGKAICFDAAGLY